MVSSKATAPVAVDTNGDDLDERHQSGTCRRQPFGFPLDFIDCDDEEIAGAAREALAMAGGLMDGEDEVTPP